MLESIKKFIKEEKENEYMLDIWEPMVSNWSHLSESDRNPKLESLLSKLMEFERACIEEGDIRLQISITKDFNQVNITIIKSNGANWVYVLHPYGYKGNWEIFKVIRNIK